MRWHDDQIGGNLLRKPADFIERRCAAEDMAVRRRDAVFARERSELSDNASFSVLLIWHERKGDNWRCWCHKVSVIKVMNMCEMH